MIEIQTINSSANLQYFQEYLIANYDLKNLLIRNNCVCLEFNTEPTQAEETDIINYYNSITVDDWIQFYKNQKFEEINVRTGELIQQGYLYAGHIFSLSERAQTNILALYTTREDPAILYPIMFNTKDDLTVFEVPDSTTVANMYYTALGTKKAHLDSGSVLKNQVRAATTINEIDLVQDDR